MAGDGQGLGEKIRVITAARDEDGSEVALANPIPDPMPAHVNRLRHFEVYAIGRETDSDLIVAEDWGRGLGVSHVGQDLPLIGCDAGGGKGAGVFRLRHEGTDDGNASAMSRDGVVDWGRVVAVP